MNNRFSRLNKIRTLVFGAATISLLWLPAQAQSTAGQSAPPQDNQAAASQDGQEVRNFDPGRDRDRREVASFDLFLDQHREVGEQVRRDPSLLTDQRFLNDHPVLQSYLQNSPRVRDWVNLDAPAFMRQVDRYNRDPNGYLSGNSGQGFGNGGDRERDRREVASFNVFLDQHREVAEQVRRDPSLLDNQRFLNDHPALSSYIQNSPRVRELIQQNPNGFMEQVNFEARSGYGDRDPMRDHMADFGGFLHSHSDIQRDMQRDPNCFKDQAYMQNHTELDAYLNAHPDVRNDLMANPQSFVQGAQQFNGSAGAGVSGGVQMNGRGTATGAGATGTSTTPSTTTPATTHDTTKPNQ